jgi:hypothetical protein
LAVVAKCRARSRGFPALSHSRRTGARSSGANATDIVALRIARLPDRDEHGGGDDTERQPAGAALNRARDSRAHKAREG